jgi:hypothetical protein
MNIVGLLQVLGEWPSPAVKAARTTRAALFAMLNTSQEKDAAA